MYAYSLCCRVSNGVYWCRLYGTLTSTMAFACFLLVVAFLYGKECGHAIEARKEESQNLWNGHLSRRIGNFGVRFNHGHVPRCFHGRGHAVLATHGFHGSLDALNVKWFVRHVVAKLHEQGLAWRRGMVRVLSCFCLEDNDGKPRHMAL